jgi:Domain of unknown function (DUF397)
MSTADLRWRKSSRSNAQGNECVEIALVATSAAIRDSKNPGGGFLMISAPAWERLRSAIG